MPTVFKALVVLVLGLLLLGGAGFGGWYLYNTYLVPEEGAAKKEEPPPPKPVTGFVRLPPLVVPVIGPNKVEQFVTVVVSMEVVQEKLPIVQANMPRLSDGFLTALYGAVADKSVMKAGLVNIPAVKEKLMESAGKVVGQGIVINVLIQAVTQRNL